MPTARELASTDATWKATTIERGWGSTLVARLGELIDTEALPGFVAERAGRLVGLTTFQARTDGVEVVTIQALTEGTGVGRSLMDLVRVVHDGVSASRRVKPSIPAAGTSGIPLRLEIELELRLDRPLR